MMDIKIIRAGQMYRYYLRQTVVGDGHRPARTPLREAQEQAGVPAGRWMGRGLAVLGLAAGEEVTESQLRNLFGERGRHPDADRMEVEALAAGKSPKQAFKAGALGRRVMVTGFDLVFRPQPTIYLLWALGDEETRLVIEAAHERAIVRVLEWIEDEAAIIRYGKDGIYKVRPPGGLVAARFRHYEARSGMPLLHDHVLLSVKGQRLDGKWGSIHSDVVLENTVAASSLYNELVAAEVCEELGLATEPRIVSAGRRPVMEIAGVPHELIRWTAVRGEQIAACLVDLEHEYVTAVDDNGELKFLPAVSERARVELMRIAAYKTRPPKQKEARSLAQLRADWKKSAIATSKVAADVIHSLLERARAAAAAIRARVAAVVDVGLAAVNVAAVVFVMNGGGRFHRRHMLAEARRHLALVLRGRRRDPGLDETIVAAAISEYCLDISEPKTTRGLLLDYRLYTARWALSDLVTDRRPPTAALDPDRLPPADPGAPAPPAARPPGQGAGEWDVPRVPLSYDRAVLAGAAVREKLRATVLRGREYDVVAHQQAAMPEQLLAPPAADPEDDRPEPKDEPRTALDMAVLRALRESSTDVEALDFTAEQLRRVTDAYTKAAEGARERSMKYGASEDAPAPRPAREDDQRAHRLQQPDRHRGPEAGR
ncbi:MobF family relaxase [Streptomyces antarcticus]|uniref:MobF family relaxase n=1 Tax=Streptomyces antarcticus TaxID=2996458 RepID=UPI00226D64A1|nr:MULTISPECIES: MobF family relaxase [unclassified Streptomyces]MCY0947020.1 relaxase domain-containing protein [Streptomyces sp. H34-AA3]MCZ4088052.1 relaxase domain-containing protein [Streptomyces sp. H34-S5]